MKTKTKKNLRPIKKFNNNRYEAEFKVKEMKIWDRNNKNPEQIKAVEIDGIANTSFSSKGITKFDLIELDCAFKNAINFAKEKQIEFITFNTWIFVKHPKLETYFKKKYGLTLEANDFKQIENFTRKFIGKKINGIDFEKGVLLYTDAKGILRKMHYPNLRMPEYVFKITSTT
jgi:hypothetical protein